MTQQDIERKKLVEQQASNAEQRRHNRASETLEPITAGISAGGRYASAKGKKEFINRNPLRAAKGDNGKFHLVGSLGNHPKWYTNYPSSARAGDLSWLHSSKKGFDTSVPNGGILVIKWLPTIGDPEAHHGTALMRQAPTGINAALYEIQIKNRAANSGAKNYEQSDIGINLMAVDSVVTIYCECVRAYGLYSKVDPWNSYQREDALKALGINPNLTKQELESMYFRLQAVRRKMENITIPLIPLIERHAFLASSLFKDEDLRTSKIIAYQCECFGILRENIFNLPRFVEYRPTLTDWSNPMNVVANLETMVDTLLQSTDFVTIMGDLAKAFGDKGFKLPDFDILYAPEAYFDATITTQVDNTRLAGRPCWPRYDQVVGIQLGLYDVWDAGGYLAQGGFLPNPATNGVLDAKSRMALPFAAAAGDIGQVVLDAPIDDPSSDDVLVLSRNMFGDIQTLSNFTSWNTLCIWDYHVDPNDPGSYTATSDQTAYRYTEGIVNGMVSYTSNSFGLVSSGGTQTLIVANYGSEIFTTAFMYYIDAFDTAHAYALDNPAVLAAMAHAPQVKTQGYGALHINNAINVPTDVLARMHYASLYSEFTFVTSDLESLPGGRKSR